MSASGRLGIAWQTTVRGIKSLGLGIVGEVPAPAPMAKDEEGSHQEDEGRESDGGSLRVEALGSEEPARMREEMLVGKEV